MSRKTACRTADSTFKPFHSKHFFYYRPIKPCEQLWCQIKKGIVKEQLTENYHNDTVEDYSMRTFKSIALVSSCSTFLACLLLAGCGMWELSSTWRDRVITIDGRDEGAEWENACYFFDEKKITIGVMNDENDLYLRLSTRDRMLQRQFVVRGLIVWFDQKESKKRTFGITIPPRMRGMEMEMTRSGGTREREENPDQFPLLLESGLKEIEIIGPGKNERLTLSCIDVREWGLDIMLDCVNNNLVYEVKIPLARSELHPYGITTEETDIIGIGIEMGKMDSEKMMSRRNGRGDPGGRSGGGPGGRNGGDLGGMGGRGGSGGMGGGRRPGGMGGQRPGMMQQLELWMKVQLAREAEA